MTKLILAAALLLASAPTLRAQTVPTAASLAVRAEPSLVTPEEWRQQRRAGPSVASVVRGGAIGFAAGGAAGVLLGYAFADTPEDNCTTFCGNIPREGQALLIGIAGAAIGTVVGGTIALAMDDSANQPVSVTRRRDGGTALALRVAF